MGPGLSLRAPRWLLVALFIVVSLGPSLSHRPAKAAVPTISLSVAVGSPGQTIEIRGANFPAARDGVTLWGHNLEPVALNRTGGSGSVRAIFSVPDVPPGTYAIHQQFGATIASTNFTVTGPATVRFQDAVGSPAVDATEPAPEPTEPAPTDTAAPPPADTATAAQLSTETATALPPTDQPTDPPVTVAQSDNPTVAPTVTFLSVADAYVSSDAANQNYGSDPLLKSDSEPAQEAYLRFAISGVGSVRQAILRIFVSNGSGASSEIFGIGADWNENSITWTSRPALATEKVAASQTAPEGTWVEYDVSSLVTGDGTVNLGLFNTHSDGIGFSSREGSNPPQLLVVPGKQIVPTVPTASASTGKFTVAVAGPADGTTLSDTQDVKLTVSVSGSGSISKVELYDNDALVATEDAAPFTYTWAISSKSNGDHVWTAVAYDNAGGSTTSAPLKLSVDISGTPTAASGSVTAAGETAPVPHSGDAADDPAIWVHPTDPSLSTIIGTDKLGGLAVYDLAGKQLFYYADSSPNNVDVRYKFPLGGKSTDIVVTSATGNDTIRIYRVNPGTRGLEYIAARNISTGIGVAGIALYHSASSGKYYVFIGDNSGTIQQWELFDNGAGKVDAKQVRTLSLSSVTEGMVADDGTGALYVAQEDVALWRYKAEPNGGSSRTKVADVDNTYLTADIEGLAIYYGGSGYLIASSQGSDNYAVFARDTNAYLGQFAIADGTVDGVTHTDGIDVTNVALGGSYRTGMFVAQDNTNDGGDQNFKMVPWDRIAKSVSPALKVDTSFDPRSVGGGGPTLVATEVATRKTYYVDSVNGSDSNAGTSSSRPWRSLSKANSAPLNPGDRMLFKRGSVFNGTLKLSRSGVSGSSILIGAYGTGAAPLVQKGYVCGDVSGSYVVVQDMQFSYCTYAGIEVGGSKNLIRRNTVSRNVIGISIRSGAVSNRVQSNVVRNNNKMHVLTQGGSDDSGAFGILLRGDYTDVSYNSIAGSDAFSYDFGRDGAAVEVYGGKSNKVHHNLARNNDAFTELGNSRAADNTFAYNVVTSTLATSVFVVTRGSGNGFGPVYRTRLYNNSVLFTGSQSQGFVCSSGCGSSILIMRNNLIQAVWKAGYADKPFDEDYNLYYGGITQFSMGGHSKVANPRFVDPAAFNLHLQSNSPAIDRGIDVGYTSDRSGDSVPLDGDLDGTAKPDIGAYEY